MRIAVFPGSFDPITYGHLDILRRASKLFDKVVLLFAINPDKKERFSLSDRFKMAKGVVEDLENVQLDFTDGMTIDYCHKVHACAIIRGLRDENDFEYESKLAMAYKEQNPDIEIIYFMASRLYCGLSSTSVNKLHENGKAIGDLVPPSVEEIIDKK